MGERTLQKRLCQNFCPYYKPSKNEELACRGFLVVERLIKNGKELHFESSHKRLNELTEGKLLQHMCPACTFYKHDCDFVKNKQQSNPPFPPLIKGGRGDFQIKKILLHLVVGLYF
ncbi:MAG: hypothetical protein FJ241_06245 [Nitrospira sp.]|nr:hypothetical protein [Nitrospira sp.]